jgi:hypothetical protein
MSDTLKMATLELQGTGIVISAARDGRYNVMGRDGAHVSIEPTLEDAVALARKLRDIYAAAATAVTGV